MENNNQKSIQNNPGDQEARDLFGNVVLNVEKATTVPSPFPSLLAQVTEGSILALSSHDNDITKVTKQEILVNATITSPAYDYYYGNPLKIIAEMHNSIEGIILNIIKLITTKYPDSGLHIDLSNE